MPLNLQDLDSFPRAHIHYATFPECTRRRQGANYANASSELHVTGNSVEDAEPSQKQWKCMTFHTSWKREPGVEEVREERWDAEGNSLFVCFDLREVGEESFCEKLEQHLPQINQLCMHYGPDLSRKHPVVGILTRNKAPQMEILALNCSSKLRRTTSDLQAEELFCDHVPRLWRMSVMPGMGIVPSALSQLTWYRVLHQADERLNGFDLYAQLSLMRSLEVLEIESDTQGKLNWEGRLEIQMQQLRELTIKDDTYNCDQLLAKITVPAPCSVEVTFFGPHAQDTCMPERRYLRNVGNLVRSWIAAGRDGMTNDQRTVRTPDPNEGSELILRISKEDTVQRGWHATWILGGRLAARVCAGLESSNGI